MTLLDHNKKGKNPDKNVNIKTKSVSRKDAGFGDNPKKQMPNFDVNMRINNHTRNAVLSLAKISKDGGTANSVISDLIDSHVKKLNEKEFNDYQELFNAMEQRDYLSMKIKK